MSAQTDPAPGHAEIERIVAPNRGPMTLEGTNTYVVAAAEGAYVIDPGPDDAGHLDAVREAASAHGEIAGVLLTHSHSDHTAGARTLRAPIIWGAISQGDETHALAAAAGGPALASEFRTVPTSSADAPTRVGPFSVIPTPGHAADHVCFTWGRVCFCGDLVVLEPDEARVAVLKAAGTA